MVVAVWFTNIVMTYGWNMPFLRACGLNSIVSEMLLSKGINLNSIFLTISQRHVSGCNEADQVIALITVCIEDRTTAGPAILSAVTELGFNQKYVGIQISKNTGRHPVRSRWARTVEGQFRLHC